MRGLEYMISLLIGNSLNNLIKLSLCIEKFEYFHPVGFLSMGFYLYIRRIRQQFMFRIKQQSISWTFLILAL